MKITRKQLRKLIETVIIDPKGKAVSSADAMRGAVKKSKEAIASMGYPDAADKLFNKQGTEGIEQGIALASDNVKLDDFEGAAVNIGYDKANKPDAGFNFPSPFNPDTTIIKVVYYGIENLLDHPGLGSSTEYGPHLNIKLSNILKTQSWLSGHKYGIDELWNAYILLKKGYTGFTSSEFEDMLTSIYTLKDGIAEYIISNDPVNGQDMQMRLSRQYDTMIDYFPRTLFTRFWMELESMIDLAVYGK